MIVIALGSNLAGPAGPPQAQLEAALVALGARGVRIVRRSRWWRSDAWPDPADPPFVNGVAIVATALDPRALLATLHEVEKGLGRARGPRNAPRTVDLDLIDYEGVVRADGAGLVLPHPRLAERAFVLRPLAELAPHWRHPVDGRTAAQLLAALPPARDVEPIEIAME